MIKTLTVASLKGHSNGKLYFMNYHTLMISKVKFDEMRVFNSFFFRKSAPLSNQINFQEKTLLFFDNYQEKI